MKRKRSLVTVLAVGLASLGISGVAAGAAQAKEPVWYVNGAELSAGTGEGFTAVQASEAEVGVKELESTVSGIKVVINCKKFEAEGSIVGTIPGTDTTNTGEYRECKSSIGKLANGTITLEPTNTTLVWQHATGEEALDKFVPQKGTKFADFTLEGTPLKIGEGKYEVVGEALGEVRPVAEEVETGELIFPSREVITKYFTGDPPNRVEHTITPLEVVGPAGKGLVTKFIEKDLVTLTSTLPWGVFPEGKEL